MLGALEDAMQLEQYGHSWQSQWRFEIPKQKVADSLSRDLALLQAAVKGHPDNAELLLLTSLVAHYAYNVDAISDIPPVLEP